MDHLQRIRPLDATLIALLVFATAMQWLEQREKPAPPATTAASRLPDGPPLEPTCHPAGDVPGNSAGRSEQSPSAASATPGATDAVAAAHDLSSAFRAAANRVIPALVAVETGNQDVTRRTGGDGRMPKFEPDGRQQPFGSPWDELFPKLPGDKGSSGGFLPKPPRRTAAIGSGVVYDASGLILTNHHVIAGSPAVTVRLQDGREFPAARVWSDPSTDVAVLRIEGATDLVPAVLGDSDRAAVGDWVLALGQPFGLESTVTAGIISGLHRSLGITRRDDFLQTDAAINPGNSGGPLVNLAGEVIGINTAISSHDGGNDGIGFAVPVNMACWAADQLVRTGRVRRSYLGVGVQRLTPALAAQLRVASRAGVVVTEVSADSPAAQAGLQPGDVIVRFAGADIASPQQLQIQVERSAAGQAQPIQILRGQEPAELSVTPSEWLGDLSP